MKQISKILIGLTCSSVLLFGTGFPSSYYKLKGKAQKREFINILKPLVDKSNVKTMQERVFIENFFNQALNSAFRSLNSNDLQELLKISKKYRVKTYLIEIFI